MGDENNFNHWDQALGEWMGVYDETDGGNNCQDYKKPNMDNIEWAKDTVQGILTKWGDHEALYAIEPVNEPWWCSDHNLLQTFYRDVKKMMEEQQPRLKFVFHDSFHFGASDWNDMFSDEDGWDNVVMDTHQYDVWVGEWSLASDVCALWLGGFNDANTDVDSRAPCQRVQCPTSYMTEQAVDFDRAAAQLGPYGENGQ